MPAQLAPARLGKSERLKDPTRISAVAVFDPDGRMLLGRRRDDGLFGNPGGHAEPGESPLDVATRELWEEAGIQATPTWVGRGRSGDYLVDCFRVDLLEPADPTSEHDPDEEVPAWEWVELEDGRLPAAVAAELHVPVERNVLVRVLGLAPGGDLSKAEDRPRDILVCIPRGRLAQVEAEERQVAEQVAAGHKPPTYYWTVHRPPRQTPRRIYFAWDGAVRAYHEVVGTLDRPDPRVVMDHRIHEVPPQPVRSFRGWRYYEHVPASLSKAEERIVGQNHSGRLLHGTTSDSAKAFVAGKDLPEAQRKRTLSEFGSGVIYASDPEAPHQASMFAKNGSGKRTMVEFKLRPGSRVLDFSKEMARRPAVGQSPLAFSGRPSHTDDMGKWLQETRAKRGKPPLPEERLAAEVDPTHPEFNGAYYASILPGYVKDRGYHGFRFHDETVLVDRNAIESARQLKPKEIEAVHATPRAGKPTSPGSLYSEIEKAEIDYQDQDTDINIPIDQDEVARLLQHPDPRERSLALKGAGVRRHHLEAALLSGDPALEQAALAHPGLDPVLVGRLFQEPGRWDLKARLATRDDLRGEHLAQLLRTCLAAGPRTEITAKELEWGDGQPEVVRVHPGDPGAASCAEALLRDPRLPRDALQDAWDAGCCRPLVLRHPSCPPDVLRELGERALASRVCDLDAMAALRHPSCPPDVLAAAVRSRQPELVAAAAANPDLPAELVGEVLATATLPLPPGDLLSRSHYEEARRLALAGWNVQPEHLELAGVRDSRMAKHESSPSVNIVADLGSPPHEGYNDFRDRARVVAAQLDVSRADKPLVVDEPEGERPGVLYRVDYVPEPWQQLAAQAAWGAAGLHRCVVPAVLAEDRNGRPVLVRRLERGWQPVAELAEVSALGWRVPLDARLLRLEAARIGALDWLLGFRGRHGWSLFLDDEAGRWVADVGVGGGGALPAEHLEADWSCLRDVGVADLLPQALAWLEGVGPAVLTVLLRYLPKTGPGLVEAVRGRLAALPTLASARTLFRICSNTPMGTADNERMTKGEFRRDFGDVQVEVQDQRRVSASGNRVLSL